MFEPINAPRQTHCVRPFTSLHFEEAAAIAMRFWGADVPAAPNEVKILIYRYLIRYYFHADSSYNFGVFDESSGKLAALLLAHPAASHNHSAREWLDPLLSDGNRTFLEHYHAYLEGNRTLELQYAQKGELILALFASERPGCGKLLLQTLEARCTADRIPSMLLWTDDTCDFEYYRKNRFLEVAKHPTTPALDGTTGLSTYLFRKHFSLGQ